jgi:flagellar basal body-associated protein FliL
MQRLEVSCAVRHIYIYMYVDIRLRVKKHKNVKEERGKETVIRNKIITLRIASSTTT